MSYRVNKRVMDLRNRPARKSSPVPARMSVEGSGIGVTSKVRLPKLSIEFQSQIQKMSEPPSFTGMSRYFPRLFASADAALPNGFVSPNITLAGSIDAGGFDHLIGHIRFIEGAHDNHPEWAESRRQEQGP